MAKKKPSETIVSSTHIEKIWQILDKENVIAQLQKTYGNHTWTHMDISPFHNGSTRKESFLLQVANDTSTQEFIVHFYKQRNPHFLNQELGPRTYTELAQFAPRLLHTVRSLHAQKSHPYFQQGEYMFFVERRLPGKNLSEYIEEKHPQRLVLAQRCADTYKKVGSIMVATFGRILGNVTTQNIRIPTCDSLEKATPLINNWEAQDSYITQEYYHRTIHNNILQPLLEAEEYPQNS